MVTQILNGDKHLSPEAAFAISQLMALGEEESHYFLLLTQWARAGTHTLRESLEKRVRQEQKKANELKTRVQPDHELDDKTKLQFYSDWIYSAVRNLVACPKYRDIDSVARHLGLPRPVVQRVVDFLLSQKLCVSKNGTLNVGPQITHVGADDPLVLQHHKNWRLQGMTRMTEKSDSNVFFTSPLSLSYADADKVRQMIPNFVGEIRKIVGPSESETVRCLNIDWFSY